jgi:hypothetical protein
MDGLGRMFVAASKNIGDLVQVAGNADGGGGNGGGAISGNISFGNGRPQFTPETEGQQYFDTGNFETYYAYRANSPNGWVCAKIKSRVTITLGNYSSVPNADFQRLQILYADPPDPNSIQSAPYDFGGSAVVDISIGSWFVWGEGGTEIDLTPALNLHGRGAYAVKFLFASPHPQNNLIIGGGTSSYIPSWLRPTSPFDLLSNGEPIARR